MVIGIYPLLENGSCRLLALSFDKNRWMENVFAFADVCSQEGIPVGVERSRSGYGAHAWIFFGEEVRAGIAERMGDYLLFRAAERLNKGLRMIDRTYFYQQDVPFWGVGNVVALPFQPWRRGTACLSTRMASRMGTNGAI
jgi:hypothetical protein